MLGKITHGLERIIFPVSSAISIIGMISLILMVLLTIVEIFARRFFNAPITGVLSLSSLGLVIFVFFTLAYCAVKSGHVELDIITSLFPKRVQAGIATVIYLLTSGILGVAGWQLWLQAVKTQSVGQTYGNLEIIISPFWYVASLGTFLTALVYFVLFLKQLNEAKG